MKSKHENWPTLSQSYVVGRRFFIVFFISIGGVFCCHGIDSFSIFILLLTGITDCSIFYTVATTTPISPSLPSPYLRTSPPLRCHIRIPLPSKSPPPSPLPPFSLSLSHPAESFRGPGRGPGSREFRGVRVERFAWEGSMEGCGSGGFSFGCFVLP